MARVASIIKGTKQAPMTDPLLDELTDSQDDELYERNPTRPQGLCLTFCWMR
jgi:hypothetical protein